MPCYEISSSHGTVDSRQTLSFHFWGSLKYEAYLGCPPLAGRKRPERNFLGFQNLANIFISAWHLCLPQTLLLSMTLVRWLISSHLLVIVLVKQGGVIPCICVLIVHLMLLPNCSHLFWESPIRPLASRPHVPSASRGMALPMAMKTMKVSGILGSFVSVDVIGHVTDFLATWFQVASRLVYDQTHPVTPIVCQLESNKPRKLVGVFTTALLCSTFYTCVGKGISAEILKAPWDRSFWVEYYVRNVSMWYGNSKWPAGHSTIEKGSLNHPQGQKELHQ